VELPETHIKFVPLPPGGHHRPARRPAPPSLPGGTITRRQARYFRYDHCHWFISHPPGGSLTPPGAIPVAQCYWFLALKLVLNNPKIFNTWNYNTIWFSKHKPLTRLHHIYSQHPLFAQHHAYMLTVFWSYHLLTIRFIPQQFSYQHSSTYYHKTTSTHWFKT